MESKIVYTREEAAEALCISLPVLDRLLQKNEHPIPCFFGSCHANKKGRILIPVKLLKQWAIEEATNTTMEGQANGSN